MAVEPVDFGTLDPKQIGQLSDDALREAAGQALKLLQDDRRENQILYYKPASESCYKVHRADAKVMAVGGGNGSSKTETCIAHLVALATGMLPNSVREDLLPKFRGPVKMRIVVESLTTVLHPIIIPKLQWWKWTGLAPAGGDQGHWGWVPKMCLRAGSWERAWSEKLRTLTLICRDPDNPDKVLGESMIQFMSHDQDPSDFASGDFDWILHDEPPSYAIWTENQARTMRVNGVMMLAMTWPDDPSIPVDWIFDEVYDKGREGPNKAHDIEWIELDTRDNPHLNQEAIASQMEKWTHEMRLVRIQGQPIRFSNRIHPLFTDITQWWCFTCGRIIVPIGEKCDCGSEEICDFNHVTDFEPSMNWPCCFILDPHPRKPHMFMWVLVDPSDDLWVIRDGELDDDCFEVRKYVEEIEESLGLNVQLRLIDPNMGRSPASSRRNVTWQDEFDTAGLRCDLADDSDVGRGRLNEYLKPDERTYRPRIHFGPECTRSIHQIKRYTWDEHRKKAEKDLKQKAREKYDDYPTMLKYLLNFEPTFNYLHGDTQIIRRAGTRRGAY